MTWNDEQKKVIDRLMVAFKNDREHPFDPGEYQEQCEETLREELAPGCCFDPRNHEKALAACNAYGLVSQWFLDNHLASSAISVLIHTWETFSDIQYEEGTRIYRAGLAAYLAKRYDALNDKGAFFRWALLTQAADLLGGHSKGAGGQMLTSHVGMPVEGLALLSKLAQKNVERAQKRGWRVPEAFPEDVVTRFAFKAGEYAQLLARPSQEQEFPLNKAYFRALLDTLSAPGINSNEKGRRLENIATYLTVLVPGFVPRRNVLDEMQTFETDLVVRNLAPSSSLMSDLFGRHFLVECKNWADGVGVQQIGYFLYRVRLTHASFGVVFARRGITGDNKEEEIAAHSMIRKAFHEDGTVCIVINENDLKGLAEGKCSFRALMIDRFEEVRFGRPKECRCHS